MSLMRGIVGLSACCWWSYAISIASAAGANSSAELTTVAEQSGYQRTGRYEEVERLCSEFARAYPAQVHCREFGRTPESRPMLVLIASADGVLDPATARERKRPVVLMQGGIHAGEIDGKDAGLRVLREMLAGRTLKGVLERVTFVFVPVFNVDGHERFGRWNRPNQVGPEEMGWRTTALNFNLNRDYTKADAPETQAMLRLLTQWDPILYADLHVTDGADFEHDISFSVSPTLAGDDDMRVAGNLVRGELLRRLTVAGSLPIDFYPSFVREDDPQSGFAVSVSPPRFSTEYWARRNRIGVLVETHSWKDYPTRVRITHRSVEAMLELAGQHGADWLRRAQAADERGAKLGGSEVVLKYTNTDHVRTIEFRGFEYTREPSAISGTLMTRYDNKKPKIWSIPLWDEVRPSVTVTAPRGGYVIPAAHAGWLREKFALHGIRSETLDKPLTGAAVQTFRATKTTLAPATFEGRSPLTLEGTWTDESRDIPAGSLFVPIAQANSSLLMTLLEPQDEDSFVRWGFFNNAFERKEYMEAYVAEEVAEQMLKSDSAIKKEFEDKLANDPSFANNASARLDFFYRKHSAWDERHNLYPVYRSETEFN
jgi:Zinc carboxypeptidase